MNKREFAKKVGQMNITGMIPPDQISIEAMWRIYAGVTFGQKEIGATQYQETKKAFVIGFMECFKIMSDVASGMSEEKACAFFSRLAKEGNDMIESYIENALGN